MIKIPIYYINLSKREDRRTEIEQEISKIQPVTSSSVRIDAVEWSANGAVGCAASHCVALSTFLHSSTENYALILEDDFAFSFSADVSVIAINNLLKILPSADIALLSYNLRCGIPTDIPNIIRIFSALTTSGYIVTRRFAYRLLHCFQESHNNLSTTLCVLPKDTANALGAIDVAWGRLQLNSRFIAYSPAIGKQRPSYSDISMSFADYKV
jgi:GR25 family glycosyltransferase involved in LPS biosynthesis